MSRLKISPSVIFKVKIQTQINNKLNLFDLTVIKVNNNLILVFTEILLKLMRCSTL